MIATIPTANLLCRLVENRGHFCLVSVGMACDFGSKLTLYRPKIDSYRSYRFVGY